MSRPVHPAGPIILPIAGWSPPAGQFAAADRIGSRFTYLDKLDPYYPRPGFPRHTTPMWVGREGVDAVILLSVDDMGGPPFRPRYDVSPEAFERFLAPLIERLREIDGRAPISVMTCQAPPNSRTVLLESCWPTGVSRPAISKCRRCLRTGVLSQPTAPGFPLAKSFNPGRLRNSRRT